MLCIFKPASPALLQSPALKPVMLNVIHCLQQKDADCCLPHQEHGSLKPTGLIHAGRQNERQPNPPANSATKFNVGSGFCLMTEPETARATASMLQRVSHRVEACSYILACCHCRGQHKPPFGPAWVKQVQVMSNRSWMQDLRPACASDAC